MATEMAPNPSPSTGGGGTAPPAIAMSLAMGALATWANTNSAGTGANANAPANQGASNGFPDGQFATVKATATATGTCSLTIGVPVAEIPATGTRVLRVYYKTTAPTATETMTATLAHPGGTGDGQALPQGDYSTTPYTLNLATIGTALSVTFSHAGTAAATSTGSWLVDTAGVNVADYFAGQAADTGLFVKAGRTLVLDRLLAGSAQPLVGMGIGSGTTAVTDADTQLASGTAVRAVDDGSVGRQPAPSRTGMVDTFNGTFGPDVGAATIREMALFAGYSNGSSPMACRVVLAKPFTKTANQSVGLTCTLTGS